MAATKLIFNSFIAAKLTQSKFIRLFRVRPTIFKEIDPRTKRIIFVIIKPRGLFKI